MKVVPIIDLANLAFHEGGHMVFRLLGIEFLTVLGGTLMQLGIPVATALYFEAHEKPISASIGWLWFGENFLPVGRYMQDAMVQVLPLVGDGTHDWTYLFGGMGVLHHCVGIGKTVMFLGWVIMGLAMYRIIRQMGSKK